MHNNNFACPSCRSWNMKTLWRYWTFRYVTTHSTPKPPSRLCPFEQTYNHGTFCCPSFLGELSEWSRWFCWIWPTSVSRSLNGFVSTRVNEAFPAFLSVSSLCRLRLQRILVKVSASASDFVSGGSLSSSSSPPPPPRVYILSVPAALLDEGFQGSVVSSSFARLGRFYSSIYSSFRGTRQVLRVQIRWLGANTTKIQTESTIPGMLLLVSW